MALTFTDSAVDATNQTTYTFTSVDFGTADAGRYIIVGVSTNQTVASMTIGGVSAAEVVEVSNGDPAGVNAIYIAAVPTGTSGTVAVTLNTAGVRCGIGVWAVYGITSATAHDTASNFTADVTNPAPSDTINIPANGFLVAVSYLANLSGTPSGATWTGPTEDYETQIESNSYHSGASDEYVSAQSGYTVSVTWTVSTSAAFLAAASWGFASAGPANIASINGVAKASISSVDATSFADITSINSVA